MIQTSEVDPHRLPHIQGLRGVAVIAVILFHLEKVLPGGFTGVDVFFVISGFVVTASALRGLGDGDFTIRRFLGRRARRLAPALAIASFSSLIMFAMVFPPESLWVTARTAISQTFLVSNFDLARTTGSYFGARAEQNGFLHYWSLSVEEQFFVLFPILLAFYSSGKKMGRHLAAVIAILIAAFSFYLALFQEFFFADFSDMLIGYYSSFVRLWQFGLGVVIAFMGHKVWRIPRGLWNLASCLGLMMVITGFFNIEASSTYPELSALLPTFGAALLVLPPTGRTTIGTFLGSRVLSRVGDRSYSLYLWHWPFVVMAEHLCPGSLRVKIVAVVFSLLPTYLSTRYLEYRWHGRTQLTRRQRLSFVAGFGLLPVVSSLIVYLPSRADFFIADRLGTVQSELRGAIGHLSYFRGQEAISIPCGLDVTWDPLAYDEFVRCRQTKSGHVEVALIGDSHAEHLFFGLAALQGSKNLAYYIEAGGPTRGSATMDAILSHVIQSESIQTVIISAAWTRGRHQEPSFGQIMTLLRESGKSLWVIGDVPSFKGEPYNCKYRRLWFFRRICIENDVGLVHADESLQQILEDTGLPSNRFISLRSLFCSEVQCRMDSDGDVLFRDNNHLNQRGSEVVARYLMMSAPLLRMDLDSPIP